MFERFTERARMVVVYAQEEARRLGHAYLGTEHVLLGLLREREGLAARALTSLGVDLEEARRAVADTIGRGDEPVATGQIPFTPRAKKVLELSLREAQALGHGYIGTEHVLLGLVRENSGVASRVLLDFGADAERVRAELVRILGGGAPERGEAPAAGADVRSIVARPEEPPRRAPFPILALVAGWVAFGFAVGIGLLLGWLIWG